MDIREQLQRDTVSDVGYRKLVAVAHTATVADAVRTMQSQEVGCCLVVEDDELVGIFTERNLVVRVLHAGLPLSTPITECMTLDPEVVQAKAPIRALFTCLQRGGFRHAPVVDDDGHAVGTTSVKRAVRFLGANLPEVVQNVPPEPGRYPDRPEGG